MKRISQLTLDVPAKTLGKGATVPESEQVRYAVLPHRVQLVSWISGREPKDYLTLKHNTSNTKWFS